MNLGVVALVVASCALVAACERESRSFEPPSPGVNAAIHGASIAEHDQKNAYALANGKRLFDWYNCSGCHSQGGGGMGPALMDDVWIYGSEPEMIYQTIVQGRPNGMPSFASRMSADEVWQLVAYVRSLSGLANQSAAPNRADAMHAKKPESEVEREPPVNVSAPNR